MQAGFKVRSVLSSAVFYCELELVVGLPRLLVGAERFWNTSRLADSPLLKSLIFFRLVF